MHRLSDTVEVKWQDEPQATLVIEELASPAEELASPAEESEEFSEAPRSRRSDTFVGPMELLTQTMPMILCEAADPDEDEEDEDLDYLYDDDEDDLDDELDDDLDEFEDEEEEFEDEDDEL